MSGTEIKIYYILKVLSEGAKVAKIICPVLAYTFTYVCEMQFKYMNELVW